MSYHNKPLQKNVISSFLLATCACTLMVQVQFSIHWYTETFLAGPVLISSSPSLCWCQSCSDSGAVPCTWPHLTSWSRRGPLSWACLGPPGWHPMLQGCQQHHSAWGHLKACRSCAQPLYVINEEIKCWSQPLMAPLVHDTHPDSELVTTTLWMWPSCQFLIHWIVHPLKLSSPRFREKYVVGDHVQGLTEAQLNGICSPSLVPWRHWVTEDQWIGQDLPSVEPSWLSQTTSLCSLAQLPGGSVPCSSQAQRCGWQVSNSQGTPF